MVILLAGLETLLVVTSTLFRSPSFENFANGAAAETPELLTCDSGMLPLWSNSRWFELVHLKVDAG